MKASKQCPKCDSLKVGYLENVLDRGQAGSAVQATVGHTEPHGNWVIKSFEYVGNLEAFICADCGYFEHYVKSPKEVPYDKLEGFHWLNPEPPEEGPYR